MTLSTYLLKPFCVTKGEIRKALLAPYLSLMIVAKKSTYAIVWDNLATFFLGTQFLSEKTIEKLRVTGRIPLEK